MKANSVVGLKKKVVRVKEQKSFLFKLFEMQLRKTDSDRRREIFGMDPLLVKQN